MKKKKILIAFLFVFIILFIFIFIIYKNKISIGQNKVKIENEIINQSMVPTIPEGFYPVKVNEDDWKNINGITQNWNNGLVIENKNGNQFVWVHCSLDRKDNTIKFARYFYNFDEKKFDSYDTTDYIEYNGYRFGEPYLDNINELKKSVEKYGGFYIGRFEVGNENGQAVIKKDRKAWNNISYIEANEISNNFFKNDSNIKTALVNSYIYDTTTAWQYDNFANYEPYDYVKHGNFSGRECLTGENESLYVKNIADLYGNLFEFTTERSNNFYIQRGLCYNYTEEAVKNNKSVEMKYDRFICYSADDYLKNKLIGFRIYMYLL